MSVRMVQIEFLRPMTVSILSERRAYAPYGLQGGGSGQPGLNLVIRQNDRVVNIGAKATVTLGAGERLRILTPGEWHEVMTVMALPSRSNGLCIDALAEQITPALPQALPIELPLPPFALSLSLSLSRPLHPFCRTVAHIHQLSVRASSHTSSLLPPSPHTRPQIPHTSPLMP